MRKSFLGLLFVVFASCVLAEGFTIFENGQYKALIALSPKASRTARFAAQELASELKRATNKDIQIKPADISAKTFEGKKVIFVGESAFTKSLGLDFSKLKSDGFFIDVDSDYLVIAGRDDKVFDVDVDKAPGSAGTLYGVYKVLEDLGFRYFYPEPSTWVTPSSGKLVLKNTKQKHEPYFRYRMAFGEPLWRRRAGFGADCDPWSTRHTFLQTIKFADKYLAEHPEYFTIDNEGKRTKSIALGHSGVSEVVAKEAEEFFRTRQPESKREFLVIPNDGHFYCYCEECAKKVDNSRGQAGQWSDYVMQAAIEIAKKTAVKYPQYPIVYCAYNNYRLPPLKTGKLPANIRVLIAQSRDLLRDEKNRKKEYKLVEDYQRLEPEEVFFCRYLGNTLNKTTVNFMPHLISEDVKMMKKLNESGKALIGGEMNFSSHNRKIKQSYYYHLTAYITAKLLWNPDADVDEILNDYYEKFYGPAAETMKKIFTILEEKHMGDDEHFVYSLKTIEQLEALFAEAKKLASAKPYSRNMEFVEKGFSSVRMLKGKLKASGANTNLTEKLVCLMKFDENSGSETKSVNGKYKALLRNTKWVKGLEGSALYFNGSDAYALFTPPLSLNSADYSVGVWLKPSEVTFGKKMTLLGPTSWGRRLLMLDNAKFVMQHRLRKGRHYNETVRRVSGGSFDRTEQWHHIVGTFSEKNGMSLYLDGELLAFDAEQKSPSGYPWHIIGAEGRKSQNDPVNFYKGALDDLRFYSRELSLAEVKELYGKKGK